MKQNTFLIYLGDAKTMPLKALYTETGDPVDLTSCTEIVVNLPLAANAGFLQLKYSLGQVNITSPPVLGKFTVPISAANSVNLNPDIEQNIDVAFTISGNTFTVRFYKALTVREAP